jgi:hypothetical protein
MDEKSDAPVGFNIIFPGMIRLGIDLGLEFPLKQYDVDQIFRLRETELQRFVAAKMQTLTCMVFIRNWFLLIMSSILFFWKTWFPNFDL